MTSPEEAPTGSIATALSRAAELLSHQPALALEQAREILKLSADHPEALLIAGRAQFALGEEDGAVAAFRRLTQTSPGFADGWRALGDQLHVADDIPGGDRAHLEALRVSTADAELLAAAGALAANDLPRAEAALRARLKVRPTDIAAIRMLAELAGRIGRNRDAETLLRRALELAPNFASARHNLALLLHRHGNPAEALTHIDLLIADEPGNKTYAILKAAILGRLGDYAAAAALYREILDRQPRQAKVWMSLGHILKTLGDEDGCIAAYRRSLALQPTLGGTWWSLANLKTFHFTPDDEAAMRAALEAPGLGATERLNIEFALGKAAEDRADHAAAFAHYAAGNRLRRSELAYDGADITNVVDRQQARLTAGFFQEREGWGNPADDPIFVVSLPRSGSTLIEQILASHSAVEGTMELPDIGMLAARLGKDGLASLDAAAASSIGEEYLSRTRVHRKTDRPRFVDKMPNNWLYLPLIQLILPNATIIDARRHPLGCGFSVFKQHFSRGQDFSYDLTDIGRYYCDYVRAMAQIDRVLPGRVHRVFYEHMVEDTEHEVRALLDHAGLAFEPGCLRFHENERAVHTASAQQVRRPIFREGMEQWRHYEPWLDPLKDALGPVLTRYPALPDEPWLLGTASR